MNKLLSANFVRLFKNKVFWICMGFMFALSAILYLNYYFMGRHYSVSVSLEEGFFVYAALIGIILAAFVSLFIGTEYSDGTIRNKICVGHTRTAIYLSNTIVCAAAGLFMCMAYILGAIFIGLPLLGFFKTDLSTIFSIVLCTLLMSVAFSSIYTMIAMLNQSKAAVAVINILGVVVLLLLASYISSRLSEPKMWDSYTYINDEEEIITEPAEPNSNYVDGAWREVLIFINDFLPTGQSLQLCRVSDESKNTMMIYSIVITAAVTALGAAAFQRKNL